MNSMMKKSFVFIPFIQNNIFVVLVPLIFCFVTALTTMDVIMVGITTIYIPYMFVIGTERESVVYRANIERRRVITTFSFCVLCMCVIISFLSSFDLALQCHSDLN